MKKITPQLPVKYGLLIICCLFLFNNSFAVKPVNNLKQNIETAHIKAERKISLKERIYMKILQRAVKKNSNEMLGDSTTSVEELIVYLKLNDKEVKRFREGDLLKVRTKEKVLHKGKLKIIDADHISIDETTIAIEDILNIRRIQSFKIVAGIAAIITGFLLSLAAFAQALAGSGGEFFYLAFICFIVGIAFIATKMYTNRRFSFSTSKKQRE